MPTMRDPDHPRVLQARRAWPAGRRLRARHRGVRARRAYRRRSNASCSIPTSTDSSSWPTLAAQAHAGDRSRPASARLINGPIPYSADADFVMGKVPELDNYYVGDRLPLRHRCRWWGRQDDGRVDPRRAAVARSMATRRPAIRLSPHDASLHGLADGGAVRASLQARRARYRARHVTRGEAQPVARLARISRSRVRLAWRMGTAQLVRAAWCRSGGCSVVRGTELVPARRRRASRGARAASARSTRRRLPSSRSLVPARSMRCNGCRSPTWTSRWGPSRTRSCATSAAGSSAT